MIPQNELLASLALSSRPGVGAATYFKLFNHFGEVEKVFSASFAELKAVPEIHSEVIRSIREFNGWKNLEIEIEKMRENGVNIIPWQDPAFPRNLREIHDPPPLLYVHGEIRKEDRLALAVIGSRFPTEYGIAVVEMITRDLVNRGFTIVSGLARGIDALSHQTALKAGGRTLAVLGSGIDIIYPRENAKIFSEICRRGAVLTEFPPSTPPAAENFPRRNRIISGLSLGVIVIEASVHSGSLITASLALEQGREVFAVPGRITSPRSGGTNQLIREGAKLVSRAEDVLEEILPSLDSELLAQILPSQRDGPVSKSTLVFAPDEEKIFNLLGEDPLSIDQIISQSGLSFGEISEGLLNLELKGIIHRLPGQQYCRSLGAKT
ncbi:MAG: DNA-processing protein DprA [Proteobacteria bacterium]|nr:DNA-processing protein DprA [Pseudomonadota bacterium]